MQVLGKVIDPFSGMSWYTAVSIVTHFINIVQQTIPARGFLEWTVASGWKAILLVWLLPLPSPVTVLAVLGTTESTESRRPLAYHQLVRRVSIPVSYSMNDGTAVSRERSYVYISYPFTDVMHRSVFEQLDNTNCVASNALCTGARVGNSRFYHANTDHNQSQQQGLPHEVDKCCPKNWELHVQPSAKTCWCQF